MPSSYQIVARDRAMDVRIGGDRVHFLQGMGMRYVDLETWELRSATLREHAEVQIVGDALPNVHVMDALFTFTDLKGVPGIMQQLEGLANGFRYSVKPQHYGYLKDSDQFAIKMAQALGVTLDAEIDVAPPVAFGDEALEAIWRFAELGWCVWASPGGRAGRNSAGPPGRAFRCSPGPAPWRSSSSPSSSIAARRSACTRATASSMPSGPTACPPHPRPGTRGR